MRKIAALTSLVLCTTISWSASPNKLLNWSKTTVPMNPPLIILDAHEDVVQRVHDRGDDLAEPPLYTGAQADITSWRAGGVNAVWFSIWVNPRKYRGEAAVARAQSLIAAVEKQTRAHRDELALCDTASDCRQAITSGRIAALLGIENGEAINNDLSLIAKYRKSHVRYMTLTWRGNLDWAGSSQPLPNSEEKHSKRGLSEFGRAVVREMNTQGIVVDLSHVSDETFFDAIESSTKPVIVSHSNARVLSNHPRNVTDPMLKALAKNGGVIGVNFASEFLTPKPIPGRDTYPNVTIDTLVQHIDHMVSVAGIDHVGIGSDYDGGVKPPAGLETAGRIGNLIRALQTRGYTEGDIRKIAGENFLRVLQANE